MGEEGRGKVKKKREKEFKQFFIIRKDFKSKKIFPNRGVKNTKLFTNYKKK